jgi:hypothetical protein
MDVIITSNSPTGTTRLAKQDASTPSKDYNADVPDSSTFKAKKEIVKQPKRFFLSLGKMS